MNSGVYLLAKTAFFNDVTVMSSLHSVVQELVGLFNNFCRAMLRKRGLNRYAVSVCVCVCVSVCLSRSWIMSKLIKISSKFFHPRVATPF